MSSELTSGELREAVRLARIEVGLTQSELATRAGVAQPRLSAYEGGHADLGAEQIEKLLTCINAVYKEALKRALPESDVESAQINLKRLLDRRKNAVPVDPNAPNIDPKFLRDQAGLSQEE